MHKLRPKLFLKKETLRLLRGGFEVAPIGAEPIGAVPVEGSDSGGWFSCYQILCAPSAVPSACRLYCHTAVCTRTTDCP